MKTFYSRVSYGFLCVERYNPDRHLRKDTFKDWDGKLYVSKQIEWVVWKVRSAQDVSENKEQIERALTVIRETAAQRMNQPNVPLHVKLIQMATIPSKCGNRRL